MQLHQPGHGFGGVVVETQGLHAFGGELCPHHVVVAEADRPARFEAPRRRLADVVHQCCEPQHKVGPGHRAVTVRLQLRCLFQHLQGVLVDILVAVVLVGLKAEGGNFGQHELGEARVHQQVHADPGLCPADELDQFVAHPLGGNDGDAFGHAGHGFPDVVGN
jgi:hypothetical protein